MQIKWDSYFMALAKLASTRSGCNSRPTGAIIVKDKRVIATGYNGSLPGEPQCTDNGNSFCYRRSQGKDDKGNRKYLDCKSLHAEQNALNQLANQGGVSAKDCTMYCTLFPCIICFKNIKSCGIREIVYELPYQSDDLERDKFWKEEVENSGIKVRHYILPDQDYIIIYKNVFEITSLRRLK